MAKAILILIIGGALLAWLLRKCYLAGHDRGWCECKKYFEIK